MQFRSKSESISCFQIGYIQKVFMESLVSCKINPLFLCSRKHRSAFLPSSALQLRNNSIWIRIGTMKQSSSFSAIAASVQLDGGSKSGHRDTTLPSKEILELWSNADAVCFDIDSTVCVDEGIDELAEFCGAGKAVAEWNARAMGGSVLYEDALGARLSLLSPTLSQLQSFLEQRPPRLSTGIAELVGKLKANNIQVYLISGGFRQMISLWRVSGFDRNEPTSRSGGKAAAVQQIRKAHVYKSLVMIGDGATDPEARRPGGADLFICYAGVQLREAVATKADWIVFSFEDLINFLP